MPASAHDTQHHVYHCASTFVLAMDDSQLDIDVALETPTSGVFIPPSIDRKILLSGASYTYFSAVPPSLLSSSSEVNGLDYMATKVPGPPCVLGIDEAGRGPVLGPMVYGAFFLPIPLSSSLLSETHHFDDSKVLTPAFRSKLMEALCTPPAPNPTEPISPVCLCSNCGWA